MKKKLLATAVTAAVVGVPMAAQAEVKVYGMAQVEVGIQEQDNGVTSIDGFVTEDNARGRIGFTASEDLGGGLKGIAKFEFKADTTDNTVGSTGGGLTAPVTLTTTGGSTTVITTGWPHSHSSNAALSARESYVGLQGGFGTITLGNLRTPYKYYGGVSYDPFVATLLEARNNGGMSGGAYGHNGFLSNMIGYKNDFGGAEVWIDYSLDEEGNSDDANGNNGDYSIGVKFGDKTWEGFVATNLDKDNTPGGVTSDYTASKIGGKMKFGESTISAQFEQTEQEDLISWSNIYINFQMGMGGGSTVVVSAAAGSVEDETGGGAPDLDTSFINVGYIHKFTKQTRIFGGYRISTIDTGPTTEDEETMLSVGLRKDF